jgi:outer membrane receptor protein involved in Fe transport
MVTVVYSYQRARYLESDGGDGPAQREVPNSPEHLASVSGAVPLVSNTITAATRVSFEGPRWDRYDQEGEPEQQRTDPFVVWDVVLTGRDPRAGIRWAAGVYNALDWRYSLPLSREYEQRLLRQSGRTFLVSANADF